MENKLDILKLVDVSDIPKDIIDVPQDNLLEILKVCQRMVKLCEEEGGVGLSAVQVGIPWKLFVVKADYGNKFDHFGKYGYYVNCEYEESTNSERSLSIEGCLSLKDSSGHFRRFQVERKNIIKLYGFRLIFDRLLNSYRLNAFDVLVDAHQQGHVFQHEIDHHHGILVSDIGKEIFVW